MRPWRSLLETPVGIAGVVGLGRDLIRIHLPVEGGRRGVLKRMEKDFPHARPPKRRERSALDELASALAGEGRGPGVNLQGFSPFVRVALEWIARIPRGRVATYGSIARWMGRRGAARAVGRASSLNPVPLLIPCHRVVGSDGRLVGFSSDGGLPQKARLLDLEGVEVRGRPGRVAIEFFLETPPPRGAGPAFFVP